MILDSKEITDSVLCSAGLTDQETLMRDVNDYTGVSHPAGPPPQPANIACSKAKISLFCFVLGHSENSFSVKIKKNRMVEDLSNAIKDKAKLITDSFELFKPPQPVTVPELQGIQEIKMEWRLLYNDEPLQDHFDSPPQSGIHVVIQLLSRPGADGDRAVKTVRRWEDIVSPFERKWFVDGAIRRVDIPGCYYLDISKQDVTRQCLDAVNDSRFVLLSGPPASGKSTRLNLLKRELDMQGFNVISVSFQCITAEDTLESFLAYFQLTFTRSTLPSLPLEIPSSTFFAISNSNGGYVIWSIIAAGIYNMTYFRTSNNSISPFDSAIHIQNTNFTLEEVGQLFSQFAQDRKIHIGNDIVEDIFNKTNGHPGIVCLYGRTIQENMKTLVDVNRVLSKQAWHAYPAHDLYVSISRYNTFRSMLKSLSDPIDPAVTRLLRPFLGYLDDIEVNDGEKEIAYRLTSEGVLVKRDPDMRNYCMPSPLVDGHSLDVLATLQAALALFDRQLMTDACQMSFKSSGSVIVDNQKNHPVPRESVYDTELLRILSNWLTPFAWRVVGQWHVRNESNKPQFTSFITLTHNMPKNTILLELLATGTPNDINSHINMVSEHMKLVSATEAWEIHFTCQDDFAPVEPSQDVISKGVNVLHVVHDLDWTRVVAHGYCKDHSGRMHTVTDRIIVGNVE